MRIVLVAKPGHESTGIGRYANSLKASLEALGHDVYIVYPAVPLPGFLIKGVRRVLGWDLKTFFEHYSVYVRYPKNADIYHITSQYLAISLLFGRPPGKTVVTVHDLIPYLVRKDRELRVYRHLADEFFDRLAMMGIKRADWVIADSQFSADSVTEILGIPAKAVLLGVEQSSQ